MKLCPQCVSRFFVGNGVPQTWVIVLVVVFVFLFFQKCPLLLLRNKQFHRNTERLIWKLK